MLEAMKALAERSVMERVVLLVNHVVAAEPLAMERLRGHAGKTIRIEFEGWPAMLPALAPFAFRITPPGLVEWLEEAGPMTPALRVAVAVSNPRSRWPGCSSASGRRSASTATPRSPATSTG